MNEHAHLKERLRRLAEPVDRRGVWASIQRRALDAHADGRRPRKQTRHTLRTVLTAGAVVVIAAGIAFAGHEGITRLLRHDQTLLITDATVDASSPWGADADAPADDGWTRLDLGYRGGPVEFLLMHPSDPSTLYAAVSSGGGALFKTTDGAATWTRVLEAGFGIENAGIDPVAPDTVYVLAATGTGPLGMTYTLLRTIDGGATWTDVGGELTLDDGYGGFSSAQPLFDARTNPSTVYVFGSTGAWKSADRGDTWQQASDQDVADAYSARSAPVDSTPGLQPPREVTDAATGETAFVTGIAPLVDPSDSSVSYLATMLGVYKSVDGGQSWSNANTGLTGSDVSSLVVDPQDPSNLYAASPMGVFKSSDGGASWMKILDTGVNSDESGGWWGAGSVVVAPSSPSTVYARTSLGMFRSDNGGTDWTPLSGAGLPDNGAQSGEIDRLVFVAPDDANVVFMEVSGEGGLYRSTDGGDSWSRTFQSIYAQLAQDPTDAGTIYAIFQDSAELRRSTDRGATWTELTGPVPSQGPVTELGVQLAVDARGTLWAWALGPNRADTGTWPETIRRSTDGGVTWHDADFGVSTRLRTLTFDPFVPDTIYATTLNGEGFGGPVGILRSTDGGVTWQDITGRRTDPDVPVVGPGHAGSRLYARSPYGLFRWEPGP